jgi:hypothetical protein
MMHKKTYFRLSLILALTIVAAHGFAQESTETSALEAPEPGPWIFTFTGEPFTPPGHLAEEGSVESSVEIGAFDTKVSGSPDVAAEYLDVGNGPTANATVSSHAKWGSLFFQGAYQSSSTNAGQLDFDVKRIIRSSNAFEKFPHQLGHDPMDNLEATSTNGKVVWHTDLSPGQDYSLDYSVFNSRTEIQIPSFRMVTLGVDFREQSRKGHRQAFTTSHCDTCHTYSQAHALDERTSDGTLDAKVAWRGGFAKAAFTSRSLTYGTSSVPAQFDDALHPELQLPLFDNRLQYDADVGTVPADLWPDIDKDKTRLDLVFNNVLGFAVTANGVWTQTENKYTGLKMNYDGYMLTAAKRWENGIRFRWRGNAYTIDNQNVYVPVIEREGIAGPQAGLTYSEIYGRTFDGIRYSAANRDAFESKADVSYRFGRTLGTLRGFWEYSTIDREYYEVLPGESTTTTNLFGASWRARPAKKLRFDANLKYADISNAFSLIDGACSTLVSDPWPTPWNPDTAQYFDFHDARVADTTASPSGWLRADLGLSYSTGRTTLTGKYIYWDGDNTDGNLTDWSRESNTALVTVWSAPAEAWSWYATYTWMDSDLGVPACIPVFDG